jgi:hypothetical protein
LLLITTNTFDDDVNVTVTADVLRDVIEQASGVRSPVTKLPLYPVPVQHPTIRVLSVEEVRFRAVMLIAAIDVIGPAACAMMLAPPVPAVHTFDAVQVKTPTLYAPYAAER